MLPLERGKVSSLALIPSGLLTHTHDSIASSSVQSIQGMVPTLPSIAACEGLGQLSCSLTLGLSHVCLCHQGSFTVLPRLGIGPVLLTAIANDGSRAISPTLMPSEVNLLTTASDGDGGWRASHTHATSGQINGRAISSSLFTSSTRSSVYP